MQKYAEVPHWWYLAVLFASLGVGIGCSVSFVHTLSCYTTHLYCAPLSSTQLEIRFSLGGVSSFSQPLAPSLPYASASVRTLLPLPTLRTLTVPSFQSTRQPGSKFPSSTPFRFWHRSSTPASRCAYSMHHCSAHARILTCSAFSTVMYVNLYGNSTAFQTIAMLQGACAPPFHLLIHT